jgi:hypothetical protein
MSRKHKVFALLAIALASTAIVQTAYAGDLKESKPTYYWKDNHDVCADAICDQDLYSCPCN